MKKTYILILSLILFPLIASSVTASVVPQTTGNQGTGAEVLDLENTGQDMLQLGPASEAPLQSPVESGYVWLAPKEPVKVVWTVYTPNLQHIYTFEHEPAVKRQIESGEHAGRWAVADSTSFTIPAFSEKGNWLAKCEFILSDGSKIVGVSAEDPDAQFLSIPVSSSGDIVTNIFVAPNYFFGIQFPALWWFPLSLLWIPAIFVVAAMIYTRSITGGVALVADMVSASRRATSKWKKTV